MFNGAAIKSDSNRRRATRWAYLMLAMIGLSLSCSVAHEEKLMEIRRLHGAGALGQVTTALNELLAEDPDHAEANFMLGQVLLQTDRQELAVKAFEKAAEDPQYSHPAGLLLASTLFDIRSYAEAIDAANRILDSDSTSLIALLTRGRSQLALDRGSDALVDADQILAISPNNQNASLLKANALINLDRRDEAEALWVDLHTRLRALPNAEPAARACAQLALFYRSQQEAESADRTYQECLAEYPTHTYLQRWASDFYMRRGEPNRAIELHRRAIDVAPDDLRLWARLANVLLVSGEADNAEKTLREAAERFDSLESWRLVADFHLNRGQPIEAREALEEAISRSPEPHQPSIFALADLLVSEGNLDRAREIGVDLQEPAYQHLLKGIIALHSQEPRLALQHLESALAIWPQNSRARYLAGEAALALGDRQRAVSEFPAALSHGPRETDAALRLAEIEFASNRPNAALHFAQLQIQRRPYIDAVPYRIAIRSSIAIGDYALALKFADALKKTDADKTTWLIEMAGIKRQQDGADAASEFVLGSDVDLTDLSNESLLRSLVNDLRVIGRAEEGLNEVDAAIGSNPNQISLYVYRAGLLFHLRRIEEANAAIEHALALESDYAPAMEVSAFLALDQGDAEAALKDLEAAAHISPDNADYFHSAATIARKMGDPDRAIDYLEEALLRQPNFALAANDLAWLLADSGRDLDRALSLARLAATQNNPTIALDTLGWVRYRRGEFRHAVSSFRSVLERNPNLPDVQLRLGISLVAMGEIQEGRSIFEKLVEGPEFPDFERARTELKRLNDS